jgi:hypothetical protein
MVVPEDALSTALCSPVVVETVTVSPLGGSRGGQNVLL